MASVQRHHRPARNNENLVLLRWRKLQGAILDFFLNLQRLNVCSSDDDPLDPIYTQRNLYFASDRASSTGGEEDLVVEILSPRFLWLLHGDISHLMPQEHGDISSGSELLLHLFPVFKIGRAVQILFLEFIKDGLEEIDDKFTSKLGSDTARTCRFLLLPGVSALLPVSIQFLKLGTGFLMQGCMWWAQSTDPCHLEMVLARFCHQNTARPSQDGRDGAAPSHNNLCRILM